MPKALTIGVGFVMAWAAVSAAQAQTALRLDSSALRGSSPVLQVKIAPVGPGRPALPPYLKAVRERLAKDKRVSYAELQALADMGDSMGAYGLAKRIEEMGKPALMTDAIHYYSMAASFGRAYAISPIIRILAQDDVKVKPTHLKNAEKALLQQAAKGNAKAVDALVRFYQGGRPFGEKQQEAADLLKARASRNDGAAAYQLAMLLIADASKDPEARAEAVKYLAIARDHGNLGMQASSSNLIRLFSAETAENQEETKP